MRRRFTSPFVAPVASRVLTLCLPFLFVLLFGWLAPRAALGQTLEWASRYNGPSNGEDGVIGKNCMAVDAQGNVYVTGYSGDGIFTRDWITVKYDVAGREQWTARFTGAFNGANIPRAIVVDAQGGVYVTGHSAITDDEFALTTIKYASANGQRLWMQTYRPTVAGQSAFGYNITVNPQQPGSVYVIGAVRQGTLETTDFVTIRYDANSGARRWLATYNGPGDRDDSAQAVVADASGNCYVTGNSRNASNDDFLTIKYSGATGQAVWTHRYNGTGNGDDGATDLVLDAQNNVTVGGTSAGGVAISSDWAIIKYNGVSGTPIWAQRYNNDAANGEEFLTALGVDNDGAIYATGSSFGGNPAVNSGTGLDQVVVKFDGGAGGPIWTKRYDGGLTGSATNRTDVATDLVVDGVGSVYVSGYGFNGASFDITVTKYNRSGVYLWTRRYDSAFDTGESIALDTQGNVYVCGVSAPTGPTASDIITLKYSVGSVWTAQDIAVGSDNKTRFLWNRTDGAIALWTVTPTGVIEKSKIFGPYAGLTARAIAIGSDNKVRLLWDGGGGAAGKATVWTVKADLSAPEAGYVFTAAGYYPWEIAVGRTDNKTRISWYDANNRVAIWTLTGGSITQNALFNQPTGGYVDQAIAVGADNRVRVLWNSATQDKAALWTLNATTMSTIDAGYLYGPLNPVSVNWFAADLAVGADNKPRLLWTNDKNEAALWQIAAGSSAIEKGIPLGPLPLPDWKPARISYNGGTGSDNNVRLLWTAPTGAALLYTVNPTTGVVVTTIGFGPL